MKTTQDILKFSNEEELLNYAQQYYHTYNNNAFYFIDLSSLEKQYNRFKSFLPKVTPFYAIKCNPDPLIVAKLYSLGCGFDCASKGEIEQVMNQLNADPKRIIFANPCKVCPHIEVAKKYNVRKTTFDCIDELYKIKKYYPEAQVVLRTSTHDKKSKHPLSIVYGAHSHHWEELIAKCKELSLELIGVSFHIGSGSKDPFNFDESIQHAAQIFTLAEKYDYHLNFLDLGGGFPGITEDQSIVPFELFAGEINNSLETLFNNRNDLTVIAEPGRYFASSTIYTFLKVINRKVFDGLSYKAIDSEEVNLLLNKYSLNKLNPALGNNEEIFDYYLNESAILLFNRSVFEGIYEIPHFIQSHTGEKQHKSNIYGDTVMKKDQIWKNVMLPRLSVGEYLYFKNMGAYSTSYSSEVKINGYKISQLFFYFEFNEKSSNLIN